MTGPIPPIHIAEVDDQALFRDALSDLINGLTGFQVTLHAAHGQEYISAVRTGAEVAIAIVDLHMPVMDGYATIAWIREHQPATRALALTFEKTAGAKRRALDAGACGFLLKDLDRRSFQHALHQVMCTGRYADDTPLPDVEEEALYHVPEPPVPFTERERCFIQLLCGPDELTYEQVADRMGVHRRTVDGYREAVFAKAGVHTKSGLVLFAVHYGLVAL